MNFIVGACIRRLQQHSAGIREENYSFLIHTEQSRTSHNWQEELVSKLNEELIRIRREDADLFTQLVSDAYFDIKRSVELSGISTPEFSLVLNNVSDALTKGMLVIETVNSDKDVKALLDNKGQLKLRTPLIIFIGGQILDRGITIKNLIGFFYGRNPKKFQQDTVLQHSRMYGARTREDLAVTRFYTTRGIYEIMRRIHEFDNALREAFLNGSHTQGIYFIRKDISGSLAPCSPNKIMLSNITTLKPYKRLLPIGFQTAYKSNIRKTVEELDQMINILKSTPGYSLVSLEIALEILDKIGSTLVFSDESYQWDLKAHKASLEHLSKNSSNEKFNGKVAIIHTESDIIRIRQSGRYSDAPDSESVRAIAQEVAIDVPSLILVRVSGDESRGWKGAPFWWPIILVPKNAKTTIFSSETME